MGSRGDDHPLSQIEAPRKPSLRQSLAHRLHIKEAPWDRSLWKVGEGSRSEQRGS